MAKRTPKSPVHDTLTFMFDEPVAVDGVRMGADGKVELLSQGKSLTPKHASVGQHRERSSGKAKGLFDIPVTASPRLLREGELLSSYSAIFTVDTNTIRVGGEWISFAMIAVSAVAPSSDGGAVLLTEHPGGYQFHGLATEQERFAWILLQEAIVHSPDYDAGASYLIVSDHNKKLHASINAREEPLFGETTLAANITLGFATSDSGSSITQRILRSCDRLATHTLREIRTGALGEQNLVVVSNGPITRFRGIQNLAASNLLGRAGRRFRLKADTPMVTQFATG